MYYLQYPQSAAEQQDFMPRVKRRLDIEALLPDIRDGMLAAVLYGTARRSYVGENEQWLGKTGTCSDSASRLGWFVSYADQAHPKLVLAVLTRGQSSSVKGSLSAEIAGRIYRKLYSENYFASASTSDKPTVAPVPSASAPTAAGSSPSASAADSKADSRSGG
jgi:penicillin-binding protein 2